MPEGIECQETAPQGRGRSQTWCWLGIVVMVAALAFCCNNGTGFLGRDENRYAEIAREMLDTGDWLTPRVLYVKYFEKPPLLYWLTALSFRSFGMTTVAGRLPVLVSGLLTLLLVGWLLQRECGSRAARLGVCALATTLMFFALERTLLTDMLVTVWYTAAMVCAYCAIHAEQRPAASRWLWGFAVACALAMLSKGIIGVMLPGFSALVYACIQRRRPLLSGRDVLIAAGLFVIIAAPWFVIMSLKHREFLRYFIVEQHIKRFTGARPEHPQPWWYFVPVLLAGVMPWTGFVFAPGPEGDERQRRLTQFLWVWAAAVVVFFSASSGKLMTYVLPAMPALGGLIGIHISRETPSRMHRVAAWMGIVFWVALAAAAIVYGRRQDDIPWSLLAPVVLSTALFATLAAVAIYWWLRGGLRPQRAFVPVGATALFLLTIAAGACHLEPAIGRRTFCQTVARQLKRDDVILLFRNYELSLAFYTRRRPKLFDVRNELDFGMRHQDMTGWYMEDESELRELLAGPQRVFGVTGKSEVDELLAIYPRLTILARNDSRVIFSNRPNSASGDES